MIDVAQATAPANNVVVQASAGTGKTWLLTSRILRLLLEGCEPGGILAITFTRKAASEIHQRVTERLFGFAGCDDAKLTEKLVEIGAGTDRALLETARGLYEKHLNAIHSLRTTTFHAFCQDVLRRFPLEADVPPGFELCESTVELENAAWLALDGMAARNRDGPIAAALDVLLKECGGVPGTQAALDDFLSHRSDWWAYTENENNPSRYANARLRKLLHIETREHPGEALIQDPRERERIARYAELLAGHPTATNQKHVGSLNRALSGQVPPDRSFELVRGVFLTGADEPRQMKQTQTLDKKLGAGLAGELVELHSAISSRWMEAINSSKRQKTFRISEAWYLCGMMLLELYQSLKMEQGVLDFADLEWKCYRLLTRSRNAEWVQYKLDQRIDHLLVDEFQDTNPTQWQIMLPLLQEMAAGDPERRRSVFLVGDEKQSIYRFRRADPRLFRAASQWLQQQGELQTLTQHTSRRSSPAVIHFVNLVFHGGINPGTEQDTDYTLPDFQPHDTHHPELWGRAELLPLIRRQESAGVDAPPAWRNPLEQPRQTDEDTRHRREGDMIAAKIRQLLGTPVADGDTLRPLTGHDIMILLRDRTHATYYEDALRRADIPHLGTGRGAFLQSLEVRDLINLLRHLMEPYNDLALASLLRSPVFAASEAELLHLAESPPGPWRDRLMRMPADSPHAALVRARDWLPRWCRHVGRLPVHDLLDRIYCEGNVVGRYLAATAPHLRARVEANLTRLLGLALEIDSGRYPSLSRFLYHLENYFEGDDSTPADPAWSRQARVRVMTIHAAKGLEAPVVFLADAARATGDRERGSRPLIEWPVDAPRPRHFHFAHGRKEIDDISLAILDEQRLSARREEANLLYVALTRARQMLYVSGCEPGKGDRGWYGFIEKRMRHAVETGAAQQAGLTTETLLLDDGGSVFNTCGRLEFGSPPSLKPEPEAAARDYAIDPALSRPIPGLPDSATLSPSRLEPEEDDPWDHGDVPAGSDRNVRQRGVAIHRILELITRGKGQAEIEAGMRQEWGDRWGREELTAWGHEARSLVSKPELRDFFEAGRFLEARNEIPILFRSGDQDVYGVIDRLVIREKEIVVIDYKTHAGASAATMPQLAEKYRGQMRRYGEGVRRLWPGKQLRLVLLFTACGGVVEVAE